MAIFRGLLLLAGILHVTLTSPISSEDFIQPLHYKIKVDVSKDQSFTGLEVVTAKATKESSTIILQNPNFYVSTISVHNSKDHDELVASFLKQQDGSIRVNLVSSLLANKEYLIEVEFSGQLDGSMTIGRLFEHGENKNIFPYMKDSNFAATYDVKIILSEDEEGDEIPLFEQQYQDSDNQAKSASENDSSTITPPTPESSSTNPTNPSNSPTPSSSSSSTVSSSSSIASSSNPPTPSSSSSSTASSSSSTPASSTSTPETDDTDSSSTPVISTALLSAVVMFITFLR